MSRPQFDTAKQNIQTGRQHAQQGNNQQAQQEFNNAIFTLRQLPPERNRDVLLAQALLQRFKTLVPQNQQANNEALQVLNLGVSYARSTRDPQARQLAEECLAQIQKSNP